ncbi:hypothetical protein UREG_01553 [Uncinocarpus reesii 1704]|uniref:COP9 signalosome complex subunit 1 n=1 Tax=Uncinocarpus reesii (strain UAMH 1704) TaxID=336963 RepID=C4JIL6_UNCRE|nr:uncharacterized protein UREG_01553 [Uncinocarpus reesii 1704]EEP76704.1 hypothetical protein UREG_01553 [Uncinocarpus reesii 1704]
MEPNFISDKLSVQNLGAPTKNCDSPVPRLDDPPKFDLESYIGNYGGMLSRTFLSRLIRGNEIGNLTLGRTRFHRLHFIGTHSTYLSVEALKLAIAEARGGKDVTNYQKAVEALTKVAPSEAEASIDTEWIEQTLKDVQADTDRLEHELKGYKNNLIKESIRMGNEDLGQHYHETGDLNAASKAYSRMRDYCTTTSHIASMLFKNIHVAVDREDWLAVQSNCHRLRNFQFKPDDETKNKAKMWASLGLSQLATGAYYDAATSFLSTDSSLADSYKEVISPNDVAVYGGLCALASMSRTDLIKRVMENKSFRNFLELEPHIRRAISFFCGSKFRSCLDILESYRVDYSLDVHLHRHVRDLYAQIRTKAMRQYILPYRQITLTSMASMFSPNEMIADANGTTNLSSSFLLELIGLVQNGTLDARVDLEKGVLVTRQTNKRRESHKRTMESIEEYLHISNLQLLQLNMWHASLKVPEIQQHDSDTLGQQVEPHEELSTKTWKTLTDKFQRNIKQ